MNVFGYKRTDEHDNLKTALRLLRDAADRIEREGMRLQQSSEWIAVHVDEQMRITDLRVNMHFSP